MGEQLGPFATESKVSGISDTNERYVPLIDPYNAAMHLGHMASYKHALRYAYGKRVLDVGCGTGYGVHYLASFGTNDIVAVDRDKVALDYARRVYAHSRIHYQCNMGEHLPFPDSTFEFVFSSQVVEHTVDPMRFLAEIRRVLVLGGFCLVIAPNKDLFSPPDVANPNVFHVNEMNLSKFESLGWAVFPRVEMAGVPQNCLMRQPDSTLAFKPNELLRLEDYRVQKYDLAHCENLMLLGHTQADGEFSVKLPDSLEGASSNLAPCFWDRAADQWVELGLYPSVNTVDDQPATSPRVVQQVFCSPCKNLFKIRIALARVGTMPIEIVLRDHSSRGPVLARAIVQPTPGLDLTFEPIADSAGRKFCLELYPRFGLDGLLHKRDKGPQFEYRGGQLALWTFHQTLPADVY